MLMHNNGEYNLIFSEDKMFLSSKKYKHWKEIQDEYINYKVSLGFNSLKEVSEHIVFDYKLHEPLVAEFLLQFEEAEEKTIEINLFDLKNERSTTSKPGLTR